MNGKTLSDNNASTMYWTFGELIAHASRNTRLQIGDVIGSGTVGFGCLLEFPDGTHPWLQPGDVVELEAEGIGVLRATRLWRRLSRKRRMPRREPPCAARRAEE